MIKQSFNKDWEFTFDNRLDHFSVFGFAKYSDASGAAGRILKHSNWDKIDLPHDWAVALPKDTRANALCVRLLAVRYNGEQKTENKIQRLQLQKLWDQ